MENQKQLTDIFSVLRQTLEQVHKLQQNQLEMIQILHTVIDSMNTNDLLSDSEKARIATIIDQREKRELANGKSKTTKPRH